MTGKPVSNPIAWVLLALWCCCIAASPAAAQAADAPVCKPVVRPSDGGPFGWPTTVFFDSHSDQVSLRGRLMLDAFARRATELHVGQIDMEAHVDSAEFAADDRSLDARRVRSISAYLANKSLRVAISVTLLGDRYPIVPTAPGVAEAQDRFVRITVRGSYDDYTHQAERKLLCRRWTLANCIGPSPTAIAEQCRNAIDFLIRGDDVNRNLDAP